MCSGPHRKCGTDDKEVLPTWLTQEHLTHTHTQKKLKYQIKIQTRPKKRNIQNMSLKKEDTPFHKLTTIFKIFSMWIIHKTSNINRNYLKSHTKKLTIRMFKNKDLLVISYVRIIPTWTKVKPKYSTDLHRIPHIK